jgi:lysozyme
MNLTDIQRRVGATPDGVFGPATARAIAEALDAAAPRQDRTTALAIEHLRREEGTILHAYPDHLGYLTIGTGRLIDKRRGGGISQAEADMLLANDIAKARDQMKGWPSWERVKDDPVRAVAMISMCFQLGAKGLAGFGNTLGLIARGEFDAAADNALKSKWAKQTPARAKRVTDMLRTGAL